MSKIEYSIMDKDEMYECALLAARAYENYEYFTNYISDKNKREKFLSIVMPMDVKINKDVINLVAKLDGKIVAFAMLYRPGKKRAPDIEYFKAGILKAFLSCGVLDVNAWANMDAKASEPCHTIKGNEWYLHTLTVDPMHQGRGIGSNFIHECILKYVKNNGGNNLALFTNSERNKKFYNKNGFSEFDYREFKYKGKILPSYSLIINIP